jgi:hypothetical protein
MCRSAPIPPPNGYKSRRCRIAKPVPLSARLIGTSVQPQNDAFDPGIGQPLHDLAILMSTIRTHLAMTQFFVDDLVDDRPIRHVGDSQRQAVPLRQPALIKFLLPREPRCRAGPPSANRRVAPPVGEIGDM